MNIDKQEKKLYFDEHLVLVLFSSQISSHCFFDLDLQILVFWGLRRLPWISQVQSTGLPSIQRTLIEHFCNTPALEMGYF